MIDKIKMLGIGLVLTLFASTGFCATQYKSIYSGSQIDAGVKKGLVAVTKNADGSCDLPAITRGTVSTANKLTNMNISQFTNDSGYGAGGGSTSNGLTTANADLRYLGISSTPNYATSAGSATTANKLAAGATGSNLNMSGRVTADTFIGSDEINDLILTTDQSYQGTVMVVTVTNNGTLTFGKTMAKLNGTWTLANASVSTNPYCRGILVDTGYGRKRILREGIIRNDSWLFNINLSNDNVYLDTISGGITQNAPSATGNFTQTIGYVLATNVIYFKPNLTSQTDLITVATSTPVIVTNDPSETPIGADYFESTVSWNIDNGSLMLSNTAKRGLFGISMLKTTTVDSNIIPYITTFNLITWTDYYDTSGIPKTNSQHLYYWIYIKDAQTLAKIDPVNSIQFIPYVRNGGSYAMSTIGNLTTSWNLVEVGNLDISNLNSYTLNDCNELDFRINLKSSGSLSTTNEIATAIHNSIVGWTNNNCTKSIESTNYKTATAAITFSSDSAYYDKTLSYSNHGIDLSLYYNENGSIKSGSPTLSFWVYVKDGTIINTIGSTTINEGIGIRFAKDGSNYYLFTVTRNVIQSGWQKLAITGLTKTGTLLLSEATRLDYRVMSVVTGNIYAVGDIVFDALGYDTESTFIYPTLGSGDIVIDNLHSRDYSGTPIIPPTDSTGNRLLAFPKAEGWGANTRGAFGGSVDPVIFTVDTTAWNDTYYSYSMTNYTAYRGSLKAALNFTVPIYIVFSVGGIIDTGTGYYNAVNSYMTIAGQTAPGGGICIKSAIRFTGHDNIIRGLRFRPTKLPTSGQVGGFEWVGMNVGPTTGDTVSPIANNMIFDHCSFSWGAVDCASVYRYQEFNPGPNNITFQWCMFNEGIRNFYTSDNWSYGHSASFLVGYHVKNVSFHHNIFSHSNQRNPDINPDAYVAFYNNIVSCWGNFGFTFSGGAQNQGGVYYPQFADLIGNYFKRATSGNTATDGSGYSYLVSAAQPETRRPISLLAGSWGLVNSGSRVYVQSNWSNEYGTVQADMVNVLSGDSTKAAYISATKVAGIPTPSITTQSAIAAAALVTANAGCSYGQTGYNRDSLDIGYINDINNGYFTVKNKNDGAYTPTLTLPTYSTGTPLVDNDRNGIPDAWSNSNAPSSIQDGWKQDSGNGYRWIERYTNSLIPMPY